MIEKEEIKNVEKNRKNLRKKQSKERKTKQQVLEKQTRKKEIKSFYDKSNLSTKS